MDRPAPGLERKVVGRRQTVAVLFGLPMQCLLKTLNFLCSAGAVETFVTAAEYAMRIPGTVL